MMRSLSGVVWTVICVLLLWRRTTAQAVGLRCSVEAPAAARHPVQGLLERFEAGPGCAARERGNKETHVIAVGRATNSPENKVTMLLKPLSLTPSPFRSLHLLLSSKLPVSWWLEAERLPPNLPVLVQVSSNSTVQSNSLHLHVQTVHSLPFRPHALHRWALKHHGNLSSLTHTTHGNRVYVQLGEDPNLPAVCQLQSMFLSHNYMTSDLQQQEVQGCSDAPAGGLSPEVHVIKLHSAGSGLCGSLQVEVIVFLVPPVANSKTQKVVLILSSSVPVNWAIVSHGVRGHVSVHVLLWREKPQTILSLNETEKKTKTPLGIHFSCLAPVPALPGPAESDEVNVNPPQVGPVPWPPKGPGPDLGQSHLPTSRYRSGPVLALRLFVTEGYEQGRVGPCVITADHRVYVEISARGPFIDVVEVMSCVVSPLSDPKKSRFWTVIRDGCSSDPSLTLAAKTRDEEEEEEEGEDAELEKEEIEGLEKGRIHHRDGDVSKQHKTKRSRDEDPARTEKSSTSSETEEEIQPLRFSFILRPVYNDSMQFLHCSLRLCVSDSLRGKPVKERERADCQSGLRIPPLISRSSRHQCELRNLSRPMVVTRPISSLAPKLLRPPAGQRTKRLSVPPLAAPQPEHPEHSSSVMPAGLLIGVMFTAFVMGVVLMGGLWCIYVNTGARSASHGGDGPFTDETPEGHHIWNPPSPSDQSVSSV
uniref:uncharacterized protein engl isoform X2 n=1 Tax=Semicossyphus pulcher TaxID=241346 RepID=UPI0037E74F0E